MSKKWKFYTTIIVLVYLLVAVGLFVALSRDYLVSDVAGAGQLLFDILLFPTIVIGFGITITEFRKSLVKPELKLLWKGDMAVGSEGDYLVLTTSKYNVQTFSLMLFVKNDGEAIAIWYRLSFDIPRELSRPISDTHSVRWHRGEEKCWSSGANTEMTHHEFKSNGQHALYPGEETHIATLEIQVFPQITYPKRVYIRYSVVTDKTRLRQGVCKIKVRPEDFTHQQISV